MAGVSRPRPNMLKDYVTQYKNQFTAHTELRAQKNITHGVAMLKGNLVTNTSVEQSGVGARVYKNGVYGFASGAEYTPERIAQIVQAATENALFMDARVQKNKPALPVLGSGRKTTHVAENDVEQKTRIDFARELDAYIEKTYPKLASRYIMVRADSMEKMLAVSDGFDSYSLMPRSNIYVMFTADTADGSTVELTEVFGGYGYFGQNFTSIEPLFEKLEKLYTHLMEKAEGVHADAGLRDVVLSSDLAGILAHEAVGHTVEADLVLGGSVAGPSLHKQVASPLVTMIDFASEHNGKPVPLPIFVDDEGTPAEDAVLIQNGVLTGYMNSRETAQHFGVKPQGNARAYLFSDEPLIRMRNTAILPGTSKLDDMIAAIEDGYFLTHTNNGQADTTSEFMFGISMGYEIKKGKLGRAIRDTTISGVAFEMLKTIDMLSDEMSWSCNGMCGKKQPMPVGMGGPAIKCKVTMGGR